MSIHGHSKREVGYSNVVLLKILYQRGKWTWPKLAASMEVRRYKFIMNSTLSTICAFKKCKTG